MERLCGFLLSELMRTLTYVLMGNFCPCSLMTQNKLINKDYYTECLKPSLEGCYFAMGNICRYAPPNVCVPIALQICTVVITGKGYKCQPPLPTRPPVIPKG